MWKELGSRTAFMCPLVEAGRVIPYQCNGTDDWALFHINVTATMIGHDSPMEGDSHCPYPAAMVVAWWWHGGGMVVPWWCHGGGMVVAWWCHGGGMVVAWWWHGGAMVVPWWWHGGGMVVPWWWHGGAMVVAWWCLVAQYTPGIVWYW